MCTETQTERVGLEQGTGTSGRGQEATDPPVCKAGEVRSKWWTFFPCVCLLGGGEGGSGGEEMF